MKLVEKTSRRFGARQNRATITATVNHHCAAQFITGAFVERFYIAPAHWLTVFLLFQQFL
jgi:hypothetical protein